MCSAKNGKCLNRCDKDEKKTSFHFQCILLFLKQNLDGRPIVCNEDASNYYTQHDLIKYFRASGGSAPSQTQNTAPASQPTTDESNSSPDEIAERFRELELRVTYLEEDPEKPKKKK